MNGRVSKQLADAARRMSGGKQSGYTSRSGYNRRTGAPFWTIRRTGYRAAYQNLKRLYGAVPRPRRAQFLAQLRDYINAEGAALQGG